MDGFSPNLRIRRIVRLILARHLNLFIRFCVVVAAVIPAAATAGAQENTEKPLSGRDLIRFLGPVSEKLAGWQKSIFPDAEIYEGTANPPLAGSVTIGIHLWTWKVDLGQQPQMGGPDRLGVLVGSWTKGNFEGIYNATFSFADADERWVTVEIESPVQSDVETLIVEIGRLPMFSTSPSTPFDDVMSRKRIARAVAWVLLPSAFLVSILLPERRLRRKRVSGLRRALILATISILWLPVFLGLQIISQRQLLEPVGTILRTEYAGLWLIPAMAIICFSGAFLIVALSLLRRLLVRQGLTKSDGATTG
jgi:hypothetical protein